MCTAHPVKSQLPGICLQVKNLPLFLRFCLFLVSSCLSISVTLWCHREADTLGRVLTQWTEGRVGEGGDWRAQTLATISHAQGERLLVTYTTALRMPHESFLATRRKTKRHRYRITYVKKCSSHKRNPRSDDYCETSTADTTEQKTDLSECQSRWVNRWSLKVTLFQFLLIRVHNAFNHSRLWRHARPKWDEKETINLLLREKLLLHLWPCIAQVARHYKKVNLALTVKEQLTTRPRG